MRHRAAMPAQRTRRFLRQEALKRSHRRCDLIRIVPEDEATAPPPRIINPEVKARVAERYKAALGRPIAD